MSLTSHDPAMRLTACWCSMPGQVELAFWAGLEHFSSDGFRLGDPATYLHPPGHPHLLRPVFSPPCKGCLPPVHGLVQLLRCREGVVESLRLEVGRDRAGGDQFCWDPISRHRLRPTNASSDASGRTTLGTTAEPDSLRAEGAVCASGRCGVCTAVAASPRSPTLDGVGTNAAGQVASAPPAQPPAIAQAPAPAGVSGGKQSPRDTGTRARRFLNC